MKRSQKPIIWVLMCATNFIIIVKKHIFVKYKILCLSLLYQMKIINVNIRNLRCYVIKYIKLEPRVRISNHFQSNFPRETLKTWQFLSTDVQTAQKHILISKYMPITKNRQIKQREIGKILS